MKYKFFYLTIFSLLLMSCSTTSKFLAGEFIPFNTEADVVPFTYAQGLMVVKAEVNGVEGNFILDNGFSISAVDDDFAKKANIKFKSKSMTSDANNRKEVSLQTIIDEIKIGKQIFAKTAFWQVYTEKFLPCDSIDGVIGASIFNKANWQIDFESKTLKCSPKPFDEEGFKMDISFSTNNSTYIKLGIKGRGFNCKVDFGKTQEIELNYARTKDLFKDFLVEQKVGIMSLSAHGLGNSETTYNLKDEIEVYHNGSRAEETGKVLISKNLKNQGYIGIDYFKNYLVSINSEKHEYILSPRKNKRKDDVLKSYGVGIYLIGGSWKLIQLHPYEEKSKDLVLMSEILKIDDLPIKELGNICDYKEYLKRKKERKEPLKLKFTSGKEEIFQYKEIKYVKYEG